MIREVAGDILLSSAHAIAHGVAPNDDFKQGLALTLREHWPSMPKDFRHYCHSTNPKPGGLWSWKGPESPVIINLLTQEPPPHQGAHPGRASLENVNSSLRELRKQVDALNLTSLAITRVATGVGGLDWKDVKPLIHKHLDDIKIPVYVYSEYRKDIKAKED